MGEIDSMREQNLKHLSEDVLVRLAQNGKLDAYDELVRRYRGAIRTIAVSNLGRTECVEDVIQDVFLTGFRHIRTLREVDRFGAWIYAIARQQSNRSLRNALRHRSLLQVEMDRAVIETSHEINGATATNLLHRLHSAEVLQEVEGLPEEMSVPMALQAIEGWSLEQISDFLDVPISTVKWRMFEARRRLRRKFGEERGEGNE